METENRHLKPLALSKKACSLETFCLYVCLLNKPCDYLEIQTTLTSHSLKP